MAAMAALVAPIAGMMFLTTPCTYTRSVHVEIEISMMKQHRKNKGAALPV
jgi:hypothetical protein